jgi:hypothetical protein
MAACSTCGGPTYRLGQLGSRIHERCQNCGMDQSRVASPEDQDEHDDEDLEALNEQQFGASPPRVTPDEYGAAKHA